MDGSARPAGSAVALTSSPLNRTSTWGSSTPALRRIRQAMGEMIAGQAMLGRRSALSEQPQNSL